jgi:hypothetical protein
MKPYLVVVVALVWAPRLVAAQDIGIAECDGFLKHYAQCVEGGAEAASKPMMRDAIAQMRMQYRELKSQMATDQVKEICTSSREALQQTFEALKCKP